jgi:hypothetical protein
LGIAVASPPAAGAPDHMMKGAVIQAMETASSELQ